MEYAKTNADQCDFILFPTLQFNYNLFDYGKSTSYDTQYYNHSRLRTLLAEEHQKTLLVYNSHPALGKFYKDFNLQLIDRFGKLTDNEQQCEEIIVTNF